MHLSTALLVLPFALAHAQGNPSHPRRHHARGILERELAGAGFNDTATETTATTSAVDTVASTTALTSTVSTTSESSTAATSTLAQVTTSALTSTTQSSQTSTTESSSVVETESSTIATSSIPSTSSTSSTTSTSAVPTTTSEVAPTTISQVTTSTAATSSTGTTAHSTVVLVTTASRSTTASHTSTATAAADSTTTKSSGLGKTALIAIIVVASVVGLAAAAWTAFRKWKLRPSNRFGSRMKPIDFSPHNDTMDDDFFEKTLQRTASNSSASRQRQELVAELDDPNMNRNSVAGIPEHDFTAGATANMAGAGVGAYAYGQEAYGHEHGQYQYDPAYEQGYDHQQHAYPPHPQGQYADYSQDQAVNEGYADLQRGGSIGSGGHGQALSPDPYHQQQGQQGQVYPGELSFPTADQYGLGRPTGGAEGPYAQAAQYRGY